MCSHATQGKAAHLDLHKHFLKLRPLSLAPCRRRINIHSQGKRTVRALQSMAYEICNHWSFCWLKQVEDHLLQYKAVGGKRNLLNGILNPALCSPLAVIAELTVDDHNIEPGHFCCLPPVCETCSQFFWLAGRGEQSSLASPKLNIENVSVRERCGWGFGKLFRHY